MPENIANYGNFLKWLELVPTLDEANIALLPMTWSYYQTERQIPTALAFAEKVRAAKKPLVIFEPRDYLSHVPIRDAYLFGTSLYRSRSRQPLYAIPSIFPDIVQTELNGNFPTRRKGSQPVIGFCGQAIASTTKLAQLGLKNTILFIRDTLGMLPYEAPPITPHILLRARALDHLSKSGHVKTNFIIRERYWGGLGKSQTRGQSGIRREFVENLVESDYVLCVRGAGNFSKRLYESLCCGRIPIFVNTDCILPFDFAVDWKQYVVWVEEHEIAHIGEKVADFHTKLSSDDFIALQHACRKFWAEWLTLPGFYEHFHLHFAPSIERQPDSLVP